MSPVKMEADDDAGNVGKKRRRKNRSRKKQEKEAGDKGGSKSSTPVTSPAKKKAKESNDDGSKANGSSDNKKPKVNIGSFFSKVSKAQFLEKAREESEHRVVQVKAVVHAPSPKAATSDRASTPAKCTPGRTRHPSAEEADKIEVVEEFIVEELDPTAKAEEDSMKTSTADGEGKVPAAKVEPCNGEAEEEDEESRTVKVSRSLFAKRRRDDGNRNKGRIAPAVDDESVDFDFLKVHDDDDSKKKKKKTKSAPEDDDTSEPPPPPPPSNQQEESPELFKPRSKRPRAGRGARPVLNYDSDSIDVDVLARMVDKGSGKATPASSSANAFTVLISKPLAPSFVGQDDEVQGEEPEAKSPPADAKTKEEDATTTGTAPAPPPKVKVNAFAKMMLNTKKTRQPSEEVGEGYPPPKDEVKVVEAKEDVEEEVVVQKKRGRPRKNREASSATAKVEEIVRRKEVKSEELDSPAATAATPPRRSSRRIRKLEEEAAARAEEEAEEDFVEEVEARKKRRKKGGGGGGGGRLLSKEEWQERALEKEKEEEDDEEISIEEVVIASPKRARTKKVAPIFMTKRQREEEARKVAPAEDPAVAAARSAFLQSSAPESIRARLAASTQPDGQDEADQCWPNQFSDIGHVGWSAATADDERPPDSRGLHFRDSQLEEEEKHSVTADLGFGSVIGLSRDEYDSAVSSASAAEQSSSLVDVTAEEASGERAAGRMSAAQVHRFVSGLGAEPGFALARAMAGYVEKKVEADTLEAEARRKNVRLDDLEGEARVLRSGRLRRRRRLSKKGGGKKDDAKAPATQLVNFDPAARCPMSWTAKYAPQTAEDVIGNTGSIAELEAWLEGWMSRRRRRHHRGAGGGRRNRAEQEGDELDSSFTTATSSDYDDEDYDGEEGDEDDDEDDAAVADNTALLVGPSGVGKTASVYALAGQLGFKVLEINASSSRSGRHVLSQLQEATQSHHLGKTKDRAGQTAATGKEDSKAGRFFPSSSSSSSVSLNRTALILFEDADVNLGPDHDDGFHSAVASLVATTKRPIVLTATDPAFSARRAFRLAVEPRAFRFRPPPARALARHLQLLCATEGVPAELETLAAACQRKTVSGALLELQLWALSLPKSAHDGGGEGDGRAGQGCGDEDRAALAAAMSLSEEDLLLGDHMENKPVVVFKTCCPEGLADLECDVSSRLPFPKTKGRGGLARRRRFVPSARECKRFSRDSTYDFLQQSSGDEEDEEGEESEEKQGAAPSVSKDARKNRREALAEIGRCLEARSLFGASTEASSPKCHLARKEVSEWVQERTLERSSAAVAALVVASGDELAVPDLEDDEEEEARLASAEHCWSAVEAASESAVLSSSSRHWTDTLPCLRAVARSEEVRRASSSSAEGGRRNRRFLHYFERENVRVGPDCVRALCDALL